MTDEQDSKLSPRKSAITEAMSIVDRLFSEIRRFAADEGVSTTRIAKRALNDTYGVQRTLRQRDRLRKKLMIFAEILDSHDQKPGAGDG